MCHNHGTVGGWGKSRTRRAGAGNLCWKTTTKTQHADNRTKMPKKCKGSSAYIPKGLSQRKSTREDKRETPHHHKRGRTVCTCVLRGRWHTFPKWDADELLRYAKREAASHRSAALLCESALTRNPNCTPTTKFLGLLYSREWRMLADAKCV